MDTRLLAQTAQALADLGRLWREHHVASRDRSPETTGSYILHTGLADVRVQLTDDEAVIFTRLTGCSLDPDASQP